MGFWRPLLSHLLGVVSRMAGLGFLRMVCALVSAVILARMATTFSGRTPIQIGMALSALCVFAAVATGVVSKVFSRAREALEHGPTEAETFAEDAEPQPAEPAESEGASPEHRPTLPEQPAEEITPPGTAPARSRLRTWVREWLSLLGRLVWRLTAVAVMVFLLWAGAKHGGSYYEFVKTRVLKLHAHIEMADIAKALAGEMQAGELVPDPATFPEWLQNNFSKKGLRFGGLDPFGRPYILENTPKGFLLRSAGPDGIYGTPDDLEQPIVTGSDHTFQE